ncbi:MAG: hypothetical protein ACTHW1_06930, partial [Ancrocorticia sp.]
MSAAFSGSSAYGLGGSGGFVSLGTDPQQLAVNKYRRYLNPTAWQKLAGRLTGVLAALASVWIPFGHIFLGSDGGWMIFIGIIMFVPVCLTVVIVHYILIRLYSRTLGQRSAGPYASFAVLLVLIAGALYPFASQDFGDSGPTVQSWVERQFDLSGNTAATIMAVMFYVVAGSGILMLVLDIVDLVRLNAALNATGGGPAYNSGRQWASQPYRQPQ